MRIRRARKSDLPQMLEVWQEMARVHARYDAAYYAVKPWPKTRRLLRKHYGGYIGKKNKMIFVAEDKGKILGFVVGKLKKRPPVYKRMLVGHVETLVVAKKQWGKGIGTKLMKAVIAALKKKKAAYVELGVDLKNRGAIRVYEKAGLRPMWYKMVK